MSGSVLVPNELGLLSKFYDGESVTDRKVSLLDCQGDRFFSYNKVRNSICVGNLKELYALSGTQELAPEQELKLTRDPWFDVTELSLHPTSEYCCLLWGLRGVAVVILDSQPNGSLFVKKETFIIESTYRDHPNLSVFQCKWFPIPGHRLILVLNSDAFLRVYNVESGEPLGNFNLGPSTCFPLVTSFSPEINPEIPIDFDFGPFTPLSRSWMLFILKPTGKIFCALIGIVSANLRCFLNYMCQIKYKIKKGGKSCDTDYSRILCSKQFPVVCVTAQDSGNISHHVMLPIIDSFDDIDDDVDQNLSNGSYRMHLKERLQMPPASQGPNSTLYLKQDPVFDNRYVCAHGSGVHLVTIKFISEMQSFLESSSETLPPLTPSVCRHLVVWNIGARAINKLLGLSYTDSQPQKLLCVLNNTRAIVHTIPHPNDTLHLLNEHKEAPTYNPNDKMSILETITEIMRCSVDQPYFCSDETLSKKETENILVSTLSAKFKQLCAMENAILFMESYLKSIDGKRYEMQTSLQEILNLRAEMKDLAGGVAEKYEDLIEKDETIQKRMDIVMYRFHQTFPILTDQEKSWQARFKNMEKDIGTMKSVVRSLQTPTSKQKDSPVSQVIKLQGSQLEQIHGEIMNQQKSITIINKDFDQVHDKLLHR